MIHHQLEKGDIEAARVYVQRALRFLKEKEVWEVYFRVEVGACMKIVERQKVLFGERSEEDNKETELAALDELKGNSMEIPKKVYELAIEGSSSCACRVQS